MNLQPLVNINNHCHWLSEYFCSRCTLMLVAFNLILLFSFKALLVQIMNIFIVKLVDVMITLNSSECL